MSTATIQETLYNPATGEAWSFRGGDRLWVDGRACEFVELARRPDAPTSRLRVRFLDDGQEDLLAVDLTRMDLEGFRTAPPRLD